MGDTASTKASVSLPDELFDAAEREAKRAQKSRSQLYAEALTEYLARHAPDEVTVRQPGRAASAQALER